MYKILQSFSAQRIFRSGMPLYMPAQRLLAQ
jgi:hypothetical protein